MLTTTTAVKRKRGWSQLSPPWRHTEHLALYDDHTLWTWEDGRAVDYLGAMGCCEQEVPLEWVGEYERLLDIYQDSQRPGFMAVDYEFMGSKGVAL